MSFWTCSRGTSRATSRCSDANALALLLLLLLLLLLGLGLGLELGLLLPQLLMMLLLLLLLGLLLSLRGWLDTGPSREGEDRALGLQLCQFARVRVSLQQYFGEVKADGRDVLLSRYYGFKEMALK